MRAHGKSRESRCAGVRVSVVPAYTWVGEFLLGAFWVGECGRWVCFHSVGVESGECINGRRVSETRRVAGFPAREHSCSTHRDLVSSFSL